MISSPFSWNSHCNPDICPFNPALTIVSRACNLVGIILEIGIVFEAYCPLGQRCGSDPFKDPVVMEIAQKHGITVAQVCIYTALSLAITSSYHMATTGMHLVYIATWISFDSQVCDSIQDIGEFQVLWSQTRW